MPDQITEETTVEEIEYQNIAELPVKTASQVGGADYFPVIDAADGYQISAPELSKYVFDNILSSKIQSGFLSSAVSVAGGSYSDVSVTFATAFTSPPKVVVTLNGAGNNTYRANCNITISTITATGFTARIYNASEATIGFTGSWIAML